MVLRLLAFNAEAWLAEHLNAYLADPNWGSFPLAGEYRAITRHLLHLGGQVEYATTGITIALTGPTPPDRPHPDPAYRRAQQHARAHARRPPPPHLPRQAGMNLNGEHIPTWRSEAKARPGWLAVLRCSFEAAPRQHLSPNIFKG